MKIPRKALYIPLGFPIHHLLDMARYAEEKGFTEFWTGDLGNAIDGSATVAATLANTRHARVGSGILPIWPRNPVSIANMWATLDRIYPGRLMLGLGAWFEPMATKVGVNRVRPLQAMKEYVESIRLLFSRQLFSYHGDFVKITDFQLDPDNSSNGPLDIPIYIGATGPRMHELAGKVADGVVMNYMISPQYVQAMMKRLQIGAVSAGRSIDEVDRPELIAVSMSENRREAIDAAKLTAVYYLGYEPHIQKASGASQEVLDRIHQITTWPSTLEKHKQAMHLIPDELVQNMCAAGTPDECVAKVNEYITAGCTCPILSPMSGDIQLIIDTFANA